MSNPITPQQPPVQNIQVIKDFLNIIKKGNLQEITHCIDTCCIDVKHVVDDNFKHTPLFYAAVIPDQVEAVKVIQYFIDKQVPVDFSDLLNQTALYYSAREGKIDCCRILKEKGCKINHKDNYGQTPLFYAAREGHTELVRQMISWDADVNSEDNLGQSALFYAAREGKIEICKILIANNANVNKQDKKKQTPLFWAHKHQRSDVEELLRSHNATPLKEASPIAELKKDNIKKSKKKVIEKLVGAKKTYCLSKYVNNQWTILQIEEIKDFCNKNAEIGKYIEEPKLLESINPNNANPLYETWDKAAKRILNHLWKQNGAIVFHEPVDAILFNIPDYNEVIKNPMDFGTIKTKLGRYLYKSPTEFINDVEQVFRNCIAYNGENSEYGVIAKGLKNEFDAQCNLLNFNFYLK